jgi:hypothetical protein
MLVSEYTEPRTLIEDAFDVGDSCKAVKLHKELIGKTGMWGYYYGSPLFEKMERFIKSGEECL